MKITSLKLFTNKLGLEKAFYTQTFGFELMEESSDHFKVRIGWSELIFESSKQSHIYHYCFLIPSNKLTEALVWMGKRMEILDIEKGRKTQFFDTWNAESFYFFDKSGNIVEFIVRYDLQNETNADFDIHQVLCVNEIGMPTNQIGEVNRQLEQKIKTEFWKGNETVFGTNGDQEGLFLLPNYELKDHWFPTTIKIKPVPFEVIVENEGKRYFVEFGKDDLFIR